MITEQNITVIQSDMKAALQEVFEKHNLQLSSFKITYSDDGFNANLSIGDKGAIGDKDYSRVDNLKRHGYKFGLTVDDIGKVIQTHGLECTIEGMSGYKCVVVKCTTTKKLYKINGYELKI